MKIETVISNDDKLNNICKYLNMNKVEFINSLIKDELENSIYLIHNFIYDKRKKVLMQKDKLIELNNLELQLFSYLIDNISQYVSNEELLKNVSKSNQMSIFSLRNIIKSIRDKTDKELIVNKNNIGYKIIKAI